VLRHAIAATLPSFRPEYAQSQPLGWRGSGDGKPRHLHRLLAFLSPPPRREGALELLEARDERSLTALQHRYQKVALLIVDELGFVPFDRAGGELLSAC
jgi:hypothetical protein